MRKNLANVEFTLRRREADRMILGDTKRDKNIVYGAQAINAQVIPMLNLHTTDYDIYTRKSTRKEALEMERNLDRNYTNFL